MLSGQVNPGCKLVLSSNHWSQSSLSLGPGSGAVYRSCETSSGLVPFSEPQFSHL